MLNRFLSYDQFVSNLISCLKLFLSGTLFNFFFFQLGEVMSNMNELSKRINESESNIRRLSKILASIPFQIGTKRKEKAP